MKRICIALLFCCFNIHAMNQITPAEVATVISDAELVLAALPPSTPPLHPKLVPLVANNIRNTTNPEAPVVTQAVVQAANDVIGNSVSKSTATYITIGCTVLGTIVTALASAYGNSKCK